MSSVDGKIGVEVHNEGVSVSSGAASSATTVVGVLVSGKGDIDRG